MVRFHMVRFLQSNDGWILVLVSGLMLAGGVVWLWCERIKWLHLVWQVMAIIGIMRLWRPPQHQRCQHNFAEIQYSKLTSTFTL